MDNQLLMRAREAVLEWAAQWGEREPRDILMVGTTHEAATRWIHGPEVGSRADRVCFATVHGVFRRSGRSGEWAALFLDPATFRVMTYTVRLRDAVPSRSLEQLGTVHQL
ncbi:hypothetical protein [Streptomyces sp. NPDC093568]|uniref:hypothetical protein n=1 Tax=Streptomyces sp. NPDC093568 TaxID=3366041 RepID=UPI0038152E42